MTPSRYVPRGQTSKADCVACPKSRRVTSSSNSSKHTSCLSLNMRASSSTFGFTVKCRRPSRRDLKLPATDQGIDLVAETNDGEFWAIQCKYRQETDRSLTWRDISTFTGLAFGVCRGFAFGIICSATERITHVIKDQERIGFCALDIWQGLDADFFARLRAHLEHKPEALEPTKPRPHQQVATKAGHHHYVIKKA